MFERFTDRARRAVVLSDEVTREIRLPEIGTVALLAGLIREGEGVAAQVLATLGVTEALVLDHLPRSDREVKGHVPFTPLTKRVLELSLREALQLGHNYIGTEHILLAMVREDSDASRAIQDIAGVSPPRVREVVIERLAGAKPAPEGPTAERVALMSAAEHRRLAERLVGLAPASEQAVCHALLALVAHLMDETPTDTAP